MSTTQKEKPLPAHLKLTNTSSSEPLSIDNLEIPKGGFSVDTAPNGSPNLWPQSPNPPLPPLQSCNFDVYFQPRIPGSYSGELKIDFKAPGPPAIPIGVSGFGFKGVPKPPGTP
jgi:hypothetical protein